MQCDSFLLVCMFLLVPSGSEDCREQNNFVVKQGEELTLISEVDPLKWCYFVSTDNDSSDQCCFHKDGHQEDCDTRNTSTRRTNTECPEYDLIDDSIESGTCTLSIKHFSELHIGQYMFKSYDADHGPIGGCVVTVSAWGDRTGRQNFQSLDEEAGGGSSAVGIIGALILVLTVVGIIVVILWKRNYLPQPIYKLLASIFKPQTNDEDEESSKELQGSNLKVLT